MRKCVVVSGEEPYERTRKGIQTSNSEISSEELAAATSRDLSTASLLVFSTAVGEGVCRYEMIGEEN